MPVRFTSVFFKLPGECNFGSYWSNVTARLSDVKDGSSAFVCMGRKYNDSFSMHVVDSFATVRSELSSVQGVLKLDSIHLKDRENYLTVCLRMRICACSLRDLCQR